MRAIATTLVATFSAAAFAASAQAHDALVPHGHPHDTTALLGLNATLIAGLAVACLLAGYVAVKSRARKQARIRTNDDARRRGNS